MKCNPELGTFSVRIVAWGSALLRPCPRLRPCGLIVFGRDTAPTIDGRCFVFCPADENVLGCGCAPPRPARQHGNETTIELVRLSYRYPDRTQALDDVSFSIAPGELVALLEQMGRVNPPSVAPTEILPGKVS